MDRQKETAKVSEKLLMGLKALTVLPPPELQNRNMQYLAVKAVTLLRFEKYFTSYNPPGRYAKWLFTRGSFSGHVTSALCTLVRY